MRTNKYVCINVCVCMYVYISYSMYVRMYVYTHMHTHNPRKSQEKVLFVKKSILTLLHFLMPIIVTRTYVFFEKKCI